MKVYLVSYVFPYEGQTLKTCHKSEAGAVLACCKELSADYNSSKLPVSLEEASKLINLKSRIDEAQKLVALGKNHEALVALNKDQDEYYAIDELEVED